LKQDTEPLAYTTAYDHGEVTGRIMPGPYGGKPHPRLARGPHSDDGFHWAAARGWPVFFGRYPAPTIADKLALYTGALEEHGHSPEAIAKALRWSFVQKMVYVADSDEQALTDLVEPIRFYELDP
jgi:alkanesulfonate monooxygenase SsuD/methylene tetrahydromethanopterin reductase-like flavin-dependent oxidoreductase (luciferase family)